MKFVICAPRYEPSSGGSIVLYKLARLLQQLGHDVRIWPAHRVPARGIAATAWRRAAYAATRLYRPRFRPHPELAGKIATKADLGDGIVVYPEIVPGNPLRAARYVRWLLYKPGGQGMASGHAPGDLYFCFQEAFNTGCDGMRYGGVLRVEDWMTDIYAQSNSGAREGACYMVRKGKTRTDLPRLAGLEVVDGLDHARLARIFNARRACYFFDPYTAYSEYAALCGCIPIVVPLPGVGKDAWTPGGRPGVAYGEDDVENAIASRPRLLQFVRESEQASLDSVRRFVSIVREHHGD
jgi:hypothetical protein